MKVKKIFMQIAMSYSVCTVMDFYVHNTAYNGSVSLCLLKSISCMSIL